MKHNVMGLLLMFTLCANVLAQTNSVKINVFSADNKEPLMGATVFFKALDKGAITNFDGIATFANIPNGLHPVEISYLGFKTMNASISLPTRDPILFYLKQDENVLEEVVVQSSRSTRTIKRIPTRVEHIGLEELGEKAIMNPANISMVLRESTGIQMQQTSLSSGNSNIRIQGLDGRYTQLLRDGFPLYGGFSSGLSIMQIPPLDLQQFEIIKGSYQLCMVVVQ